MDWSADNVEFYVIWMFGMGPDREDIWVGGELPNGVVISLNVQISAPVRIPSGRYVITVTFLDGPEPMPGSDEILHVFLRFRPENKGERLGIMTCTFPNGIGVTEEGTALLAPVG